MSPRVVPYCKARRPSSAFAQTAATARAVASTGKVALSTNPAASEIRSGAARARAIKSLIGESAVRRHRTLKRIGTVIGGERSCV